MPGGTTNKSPDVTLILIHSSFPGSESWTIQNAPALRRRDDRTSYIPESCPINDVPDLLLLMEVLVKEIFEHDFVLVAQSCFSDVDYVSVLVDRSCATSSIACITLD